MGVRKRRGEERRDMVELSAGSIVGAEVGEGERGWVIV